MTCPVVAFFNNKGGVGKTSLVYHLSWMFSDLGAKVLAVDLDPQANLTAAFLEQDRLEELWTDEGDRPSTVYGAIQPLLRGTGDIEARPHLEEVDENLMLLPGDPGLARFEDELSQQWPKCLDRHERAFRILSAFWRLIQRSAKQSCATFALIDLGPNLGAINRAGLVASDHLVVPMTPDLFSLQNLKNLGPTIHKWREEWAERRKVAPSTTGLELPAGDMRPAGYIVLQQAVRLDQPVRAYEVWVDRIPAAYYSHVRQEAIPRGIHFDADPECLGLLRHYRGLMPLAQEAHKPIFHLLPADGAIGAHIRAVADVREDFRSLALKIAQRCSLDLPEEASDGIAD